ncbi:neural cell adhesion molecule 1-like [Discoglossus pictus]
MLSIYNMGPQECSVLIFLFMTASVHGRSPSVSIIPANGDIELGKVKHFLCKVVSGGDANLKWFTSEDEEIEDEEGPYKIQKIDEGLSDLSVMASQIEPDRVIKCSGEFESGEKAEAEITLRIIDKPQFVGDVELEKTFMAGSPVSLPCATKGTPTPAVHWIHNGENVSVSQGHLSMNKDGSLQIDNIQLSDAGLYICHAYIEERGEEAYKNVTITVNAPPTIQFQNSSSEVILGSDSSIICSVTGHPQPQVTWRRGSEPVTHDGQKYILSKNGQQLSILQLEKSDEGEYTCFAENLFENSSRTMLLQVIEPQGLGKGVIAGIVLFFLLVTLLAIDLTCYRTKRRGVLMCIATNLLGKQTPGVKIQEDDIKKTSTDKSHVVNISGIEA